MNIADTEDVGPNIGVLRAWAVKSGVLSIEHTYVTSNKGHKWSCFGRTDGGRLLIEVSNVNLDIAEQFSYPRQRNINSATPMIYAGIAYGINGVSHQAANRILRAGGITVDGAGGYNMSRFLYGVYGRDFEIAAEEIKQKRRSRSPESFPALANDVPIIVRSTIVASKSKADAGRIIESVGIPWFEIIQKLKTNPSDAYKIPWERWEEIVAESYVAAGYSNVILTPRSGDFGRDVIATLDGIGSVRVIDQVKAYTPGHLVGANDVRAFYGVLRLDGAAKGFVTTTTDFAPELRSDLLLSKVIPREIELINGKQLFSKLIELAERKFPRGLRDWKG